MPKKQRQESEVEQAKRLQQEAQKLIDAGELNPIEANSAMELLLVDQGVKINKLPSTLA